MTIPPELREAVETSVADMRQPKTVANHITQALGTVAEFGHSSYEDSEKIRATH